MSTSIAAILQNQTVGNHETMTLDELNQAATNVSTAQEPIITARAATIAKEIAKSKQLWVAPTVARFDNTNFLVSGRHRVAALTELVNTHGLDAKGLLCAYANNKWAGAGEPPALTPLTPLVNVEVIECHSMKAVAALQMAYNGSRSMTAAEKLVVKASHTKLTPSEAVKQSMARKFQAACGVTFQTGLAMATAMGTKIKGMIYITDAQQNEAVDEVANWMNANPTLVPGNMALKYRDVIDAVCYQAVAGFDAEGTAIESSWIAEFASQIEKPAAAPKKASTSELADKLAQAMAMLAAQGLALPE